MARIVSNFFISMDGVVEAPDQWRFPYWSDEMEAVVTRGFEAMEAMLMGRVLYDEWAAQWPTSEDDATAALFNGMPKYVVSRTVGEPTWSNTTVIGGDVSAGIRALEDTVDGVISMSGSATLVRWLLAEGLLDELNLLVHPIAVGKGQRLFEDTPTHPLRFVSSETFSTGVLHVRYAPAAA